MRDEIKFTFFITYAHNTENLQIQLHLRLKDIFSKNDFVHKKRELSLVGDINPTKSFTGSQGWSIAGAATLAQENFVFPDWKSIV